MLDHILCLHVTENEKLCCAAFAQDIAFILMLIVIPEGIRFPPSLIRNTTLRHIARIIFRGEVGKGGLLKYPGWDRGRGDASKTREFRGGDSGPLVSPSSGYISLIVYEV